MAADFEDWMRGTLGTVANTVADMHARVVSLETSVRDLRLEVEELRRRRTPPGMPAVRGAMSDPPFEVKMQRYEDKQAAGVLRWLAKNAGQIGVRAVQVAVFGGLVALWKLLTGKH